MNILGKFIKVVSGKVNSKLEAHLDPVEQMLLIRDEFENQVKKVQEAQISIKGELTFAEKELVEMNTDLAEATDKLNEMKAHVQAGNVLSDQDNARGQKLIAKKNRLDVRVKSQAAEIDRIKATLSNLTKKATELEVKLDGVRDQIEDAQREDATANAVESYAKAFEILNDTTSSDSLDEQLNKLSKKAAKAEAHAEIVENKSDSFDFDKDKNSLESFLNS